MQSNDGIGMAVPLVVDSASSSREDHCWLYLTPTPPGSSMLVELDNRTDCACISKTPAGSMYVATITTRATIMIPAIFWTADPAEAAGGGPAGGGDIVKRDDGTGG